MSFHDGFLSELVGRQTFVVSDQGRKAVGKISDFLVSDPNASFPRIDGLIVKTSRGDRFAPIDTVTDVDAKGEITLTVAPDAPAVSADRALYLIADLLSSGRRERASVL